MGKGPRLHPGSSGTRGEAPRSSRGDQPVLASARADATPAGDSSTMSGPLRYHQFAGRSSAREPRAWAGGGRGFSARGGRLDQALAFARHARSVDEELDDPMLRAWVAMEAEPLFYRGLWDEAARTAEGALPVAWEIREWTVVFFSSAWLALPW